MKFIIAGIIDNEYEAELINRIVEIHTYSNHIRNLVKRNENIEPERIHREIPPNSVPN